ADSLPKGQPAKRQGGRPISPETRRCVAAGRRVRLAALPAADCRPGGRQSRRCRGAIGVHEGHGMTIDSKPLFGKVALLGIGLIGSSMAHAMRRAGLAAHVSGFARNTETLEKASKIGFADTLHDAPEAAVRDADFVVLATPVGVFSEIAKAIAP